MGDDVYSGPRPAPAPFRPTPVCVNHGHLTIKYTQLQSYTSTSTAKYIAESILVSIAEPIGDSVPDADLYEETRLVCAAQWICEFTESTCTLHCAHTACAAAAPPSYVRSMHGVLTVCRVQGRLLFTSGPVLVRLAANTDGLYRETETAHRPACRLRHAVTVRAFLASCGAVTVTCV